MLLGQQSFHQPARDAQLTWAQNIEWYPSRAIFTCHKQWNCIRPMETTQYSHLNMYTLPWWITLQLSPVLLHYLRTYPALIPLPYINEAESCKWCFSLKGLSHRLSVVRHDLQMTCSHPLDCSAPLMPHPKSFFSPAEGGWEKFNHTPQEFPSLLKNPASGVQIGLEKNWVAETYITMLLVHQAEAPSGKFQGRHDNDIMCVRAVLKSFQLHVFAPAWFLIVR